MTEQDEHEARFAERKRRARVIDALNATIEGAKPLAEDDFIDVVGRFMRPDESTFDARARLNARIAELTDAIGSDMPFEDAKELTDLLKLAQHRGRDWKKAMHRHRAERSEGVPTIDWGSETELAERRDARQRERLARAAAIDAMLAKAAPEPELVRDEEAAPEPEPAPVAEPALHPFADLIDATKDNEEERLRLRGRFYFLHHMLVDRSGALPELSEAERAELNSLQTRNKASENWLNINV